MEEQPREEGELPEPPTEADAGTPPTGPPEGGTPEGAQARALALEAEEIRRLVEAGAGSPEAIRELAARLRDHRAREEALWRAEVKPALVREGKGRLRGHSQIGAAPADRKPATSASASNSLWLGGVLLALVLLVIVAASTTAWLLILPLVALIAWAWHHGRDRSD